MAASFRIVSALLISSIVRYCLIKECEKYLDNPLPISNVFDLKNCQNRESQNSPKAKTNSAAQEPDFIISKHIRNVKRLSALNKAGLTHEKE
jgi:hypothetical protein